MTEQNNRGIPAELFAKACSLIEAERNKAISGFINIINDYPHSPEAEKSKEEIRKIAASLGEKESELYQAILKQFSGTTASEFAMKEMLHYNEHGNPNALPADPEELLPPSADSQSEGQNIAQAFETKDEYEKWQIAQLREKLLHEAQAALYKADMLTAIECYKKLIQLFPDSPEAEQAKVKLADIEAHHSEADLLNHVDALYSLAQKHVNKGNVSEAIKLFNEIVRLAPRSLKANQSRYELNRINQRMGRIDTPTPIRNTGATSSANPQQSKLSDIFCKIQLNKNAKIAIGFILATLLLLIVYVSINMHIYDRLRLKTKGYSFNNTGFVNAAMKNDTDAIRTFIKIGINIDGRDSEGETALTAAAFKDNLELFKVLIENGANPRVGGVYNQHEYYPLEVAINRRYEPVIDYLIEIGVDPDEVFEGAYFKGDALEYALKFGHPDAIKIIRKEYAKRIEKTGMAFTEENFLKLFLADANNKYDKMLILFIKAGINPKGEISYSMTPTGASLKLSDKMYKAPYLLVAIYAYESLVPYMLKYTYSSGSNENGAYGIYEFEKENGSLIHWAVIVNKPQLIEPLVKAGAYINAEDKANEFKSPLHVAVENGNMATIEALVKSGADINARTFMGHTPLYIAAYNLNADVAEFLLSHGADIKAISNQGMDVGCAAGLSSILTVSKNKSLLVPTREKSDAVHKVLVKYGYIANPNTCADIIRQRR